NLKLFQVDWFADEIVGATAQRGDGFVNQHIGGNHDYNGIGLTVSNLAQYLQARPVWQVDVEQHSRGRLSLEGSKRSAGSSRLDWLEAPTAQCFAKRPANHLFVVNDEDF